jgi:hypothetical protein
VVSTLTDDTLGPWVTPTIANPVHARASTTMTPSKERLNLRWP